MYSCNLITKSFGDRELDRMEDVALARDDDALSNVTSVEAARDAETSSVAGSC